MRAFALALLMSCSLAACTMPGAPDDAARLETGAGERARDADVPAAAGDVAGGASSDAPAQGVKPGAAVGENAAPAAGDPAPPMSDPLPPEPLPRNDGASALSPDRSCRTSADCTVKNVGNCCGAMPACVNKDARTDPAALQAQCAKQGMSSVCGFKDVSACSCVAGTCQDAGGAVAQ